MIHKLSSVQHKKPNHRVRCHCLWQSGCGQYGQFPSSLFLHPNQDSPEKAEYLPQALLLVGCLQLPQANGQPPGWPTWSRPSLYSKALLLLCLPLTLCPKQGMKPEPLAMSSFEQIACVCSHLGGLSFCSPTPIWCHKFHEGKAHYRFQEILFGWRKKRINAVMTTNKYLLNDWVVFSQLV